MSASILPDLETGGAVVYRDLAGNPTWPPDVQNAYSPPTSYFANCELTALPADCNGRVEAKQINAIVSEMIKMAECWDPNGPWDCSSLANLCNAFTVWWALNKTWVDQVSIVGAGSQSNPYKVALVDCGTW